MEECGIGTDCDNNNDNNDNDNDDDNDDDDNNKLAMMMAIIATTSTNILTTYDKISFKRNRIVIGQHGGGRNNCEHGSLAVAEAVAVAKAESVAKWL